MWWLPVRLIRRNRKVLPKLTERRPVMISATRRLRKFRRAGIGLPSRLRASRRALGYESYDAHTFKELRVELAKSAAIRGVARDADDHPVKDAKVRAHAKSRD